MRPSAAVLFRISVLVRKSQPSTHKANFRFSVYVVVESGGVSPCRNQQNDRLSALRFGVSLPNPFLQLSPIRRIAEYRATAIPRLIQSVCFRCEKLGALCGMFRCRRIENKMKFCIQLVKKNPEAYTSSCFYCLKALCLSSFSFTIPFDGLTSLMTLLFIPCCPQLLFLSASSSVLHFCHKTP